MTTLCRGELSDWERGESSRPPTYVACDPQAQSCWLFLATSVSPVQWGFRSSWLFTQEKPPLAPAPTCLTAASSGKWL